MNWLTSILNFLKVSWPIISMILGALSAAHANASHTEAVNHVAGADSISQQAVHVVGAGALGATLLVAGATGVVANHKAAASAPSKAPEGVDPVLHQLDVCHSAMVAAKADDAMFDGVNTLIKLRKNHPSIQQLTPKGTA